MIIEATNPVAQHCIKTCMLDGVDIADRAFRVSIDQGWADCYRRDGDRFLVKGNEPMTERIYGEVRLFDKNGIEITNERFKVLESKL